MNWGYYLVWFLVGVVTALTVVRIRKGNAPHASLLAGLLDRCGDGDHQAPWAARPRIVEDPEQDIFRGGFEFTGMGTRIP